MFVVSCFIANGCSESWLIDSGCTNHMCPNEAWFKKLDRTYNSRVRIGNGDFLEVKGKGVVAINTPSGMKYISEVLFVPEINQSLLSVGQMLEKNYTLLFQNMSCTIVDHVGSELMTVKMRDKSFAIEWNKPEINAHSASIDKSTFWHKRCRRLILSGPLCFILFWASGPFVMSFELASNLVRFHSI